MLKVEEPNRRPSRDTTQPSASPHRFRAFESTSPLHTKRRSARRGDSAWLVGNPDPTSVPLIPSRACFAPVATLFGHILELASTAAELRRVGRQHMED